MGVGARGPAFVMVVHAHHKPRAHSQVPSHTFHSGLVCFPTHFSPALAIVAVLNSAMSAMTAVLSDLALGLWIVFILR